MEDVELKDLEGSTSNSTTTTPPVNDDQPRIEEMSSPVDVKLGREGFSDLARELEGDSEQYRQTVMKMSGDVEAQTVDENDEDFKLRKYFENSQRMAMENGGKPKKMGVSVRNLTVVGRGADVSVIADMSTPFYWMASFFKPSNWTKRGTHGTTFDILHEVNTFCKDGEMLLVLGRPGAGCSTLLRLITNQRKSYVEVTGDVTYGGIPADEFLRYRGEAIYTPEEDTHHPTLTVRETLDFALKCKTPGNRLPDEKKRTFREKIFTMLVKMFGIVHQSETIVGNEWIRGLSGGERKRLDAASALDYAKSLRIMSDTLDKTTIASFYQASDSIYSLFDKVLILEKGRCIFFGPIGEAKQYFLDMGFDCEPRKSIPDFLTGVTNPQERIVRPGFEGRVPETSVEFEEAWKGSRQYSVAMDEQTAYEKQIEVEQPAKQFVEQVRNERSRTNSRKSPYITSFWTQVVALTIRHFQIIWGDKFSICSRYFSVIVQSLVYGSVFFQLADDIGGVFTRGGAIFSALLFNAFLSQGELPMAFMGRRILQKQRSYAMYRPAAFHLAQVISDIPIIFMQVFLFSIIAYFMFGLDYDAGKFFIFVFTLIGTALACTNIFRAFGNFCPSMYIAQNIMTVYLILMITYCGYTVPINKMLSWGKWLIYVNPFSFALKALMANEFKGQDFQCNMSAIPYGAAYVNTTANRICPIAGAVQGELTLHGSTYLDAALSFKIDDRWYNILIVYGWWVLFIGLNMFALEKFDWTAGGYTHKVYKRGKAPKINDADEEKNAIALVAAATSNMKDTLKMRGGVFTWQNIKYTVPTPAGPKLLLDDVEGWIRPGQMTALMGSSGAGKTTLLDVLALRKTVGTIEGRTFLNGKPLEVDFERITGYVEQMDVHNPFLTVREALRFSAKLRQEPSISIKEKYTYVEHVLEMMEMKHLGDALIGDLESGVGISVEERKRLTIGIELVAKPHILFLDEPTSGLDAQSSYNIIKFIRKLADAGMPLVCTIHQPSSVLFEHFDRLLLLAKGGKTVYFGDIGERSRTLASYFERHGVRPCTESENPAEYILEGIGAGVHGKTDVDWPAAWKSSPECQAITEELNVLEHTKPEGVDDHSNGAPREFATGPAYQLLEVYKRMNLIWWRDPYYSFGRFFQAIIVGLIIGFTYFNLSNSSTDMMQRVFFIFQALILGIMLIFLALPQFFMQREYFRRDYASKFYGWFPFALSIVVVELPYLTITGTLFVFCSYWTAGLQFSAGTGFYFWLIFIIQALGAVCINMFFAMIIVPLIIVFFFLFCGVMVPPSQLPKFWESWMYHLNPATYFLEGIVTNVLHGVKVVCTESDLVRFSPPAGMTCAEYTADFKPITGKIMEDTLNSTSSCAYCNYNNGPEYYETLIGWSFDNRWRDFGILTAFW
eukprot:gene19406-23237_t